MEYISIVDIGIKVFRIGFGIWVIGGMMWGGIDEKIFIKIICVVFDQGIILIDIVLVYGFGQFEEIVGKVIKEYGKRDQVIFVMKMVLDWKNNQLFCYVNRVRIIEEVEVFLKWF